MTVIFSIPRAVRGPLSVTIPSTSVPVGVTTAKATVNRFAWPAGDNVASVSLEFSFDGGATWKLKVAIGMAGGKLVQGGPIFPPDPDAPSAMAVDLAEPNNAARRVRGTVVLNAALDCGATIEVT